MALLGQAIPAGDKIGQDSIYGTLSRSHTPCWPSPTTAPQNPTVLFSQILASTGWSELGNSVRNPGVAAQRWDFT